MSYIDVLLYTRKNDVRVEQELQQMNDVFKLTHDINQEMIQLDENYTKDMWFNDIADRVFAFKQRIHNWLKEGEMLLKFERKSKSSGKNCHYPNLQNQIQHQVPDHQSCQLERKQYKKRFVLRNYRWRHLLRRKIEIPNGRQNL